MSNPFRSALMAAASALALASCVSSTFRTHDPRYRAEPRADMATEMSQLADELAGHAERRTSLGSVRVVVDDFVPLESRSRRYREASTDPNAERDAAATLRHELEMALAESMNVVGGTVLSGAIDEALQDRAERADATHVLRGTFQRDGSAVEVTLQLEELRSSWLVARARRRIENFQPDAFDLPALEVAEVTGRNTASAETTEPARPATPPASVVMGEPERVGATGEIPPDVEVTFDSGPAAARLRAVDPRLLERPVEGADPEQAPPPPAKEADEG